jgi:hypothetical protein
MLQLSRSERHGRRQEPRVFIRWQRVSMPAYRAFLTDTPLAALMSYVRWVNVDEWQQKPLELRSDLTAAGR